MLRSERLINWALDENPLALRYMNFIKISKAVMRRLIQYAGHNLRIACEALKSNPEVVIMAVKNDPFSIVYASPSLLNNIQFLERVRIECNNFLPLTVSPQEWRNNKEIVLNNVQTHGLELEYASERLRNDKQVVEVAISSNVSAYKFASEELKKDTGIILKCLPHLIYWPHFIKREDILEIVHKQALPLDRLPQYANDKEIVQCISRLDGNQFEFASETLRDDLETLEIAICQNPFAFRYASLRLRSNREFNFQLLMKYLLFHTLLNYMPLELKSDKSFLLPLLKHNYEIMSLVDASLKTDKDFIIRACQANPLCTLFIPEQLIQDANFCIELIRMNGLCARGLVTNSRNMPMHAPKIDLFRAVIIENGYVDEHMMERLSEWKELRNARYGNNFLPSRYKTFPLINTL